jgi:hypothetical protein
MLTGVALVMTGCGFSEKIGAYSAYNYATLLHSNQAKGIGIGAEAPFRDSPLTLGIEAGGFKDSGDQSSAYALTHIDFDLIETKPRNPRVGAFIGFVNDAERAARFDDRYPVIGNFLPFVGFQVTVPTIGPHEFRLRISPGYSAETAIFSIQSNIVF